MTSPRGTTGVLSIPAPSTSVLGGLAFFAAVVALGLDLARAAVFFEGVAAFERGFGFSSERIFSSTPVLTQFPPLARR